MNQILVHQVWKRAEGRCEYCRIPNLYYLLPFQIDHIIARQHGGGTTPDNLALACLHRNRHKGPNISGWDESLGRVVRLFHPRTDVWEEHFQPQSCRLNGKTNIGRVTIHVLAMNADDLPALRLALFEEGLVI